MGSVAIHFAHGIEWQRRRIEDFSAGLKALGIPHECTSSMNRVADVSILFGTTMWRNIERDSGRWLLVDRCSFGDGGEYVSLVWNGHGRRGNHCVPDDYDDSRWKRHGVEIQPFRTGSRRVLCGQTESYSPYTTLEDWYEKAGKGASHFRRHPAGKNPTNLPSYERWDDVGLAITLNSSVAVQALALGITATVDDEGGMAYRWGERFAFEREPFFHWLSWTQWHWDEIREGHPIAHLFE